MPTETAAAGAAWAKWGHVFAGALGVAATLAWMPTMTPRQMVLAVSSGMASSIWGTPMAVALLYAWEPALAAAGMADSVAGSAGFILGLTGLFIVGGILRVAEGFRDNPWAIIDRIRGRRNGEGGQ